MHLNPLGFLQSLEREPIMAIIHGYFDESGKQADHPVVTFTGVCVSQSRLKEFDDAWNVLLRQYGLKALHMAKASRLPENNGPLMPRHQTFDQRIDLLLPFAECMRKHLEMGLIQAYDVRGFKSISPAAKVGIGDPSDPYYLAFLRGLVEFVDYIHDDDRIALICDDDEATALGCYSHYRGVRRAYEPVRRKLVSLSFANDEYFPALQAADMLAFLSRLEAKKMFYSDYNPFRRLFYELTKSSNPGEAQWFALFAPEEKLVDLGAALARLGIKKPKKKVTKHQKRLARSVK